MKEGAESEDGKEHGLATEQAVCLHGLYRLTSNCGHRGYGAPGTANPPSPPPPPPPPASPNPSPRYGVLVIIPYSNKYALGT
jgi:hypothetical protein